MSRAPGDAQRLRRGEGCPATAPPARAAPRTALPLSRPGDGPPPVGPPVPRWARPLGGDSQAPVPVLARAWMAGARQATGKSLDSAAHGLNMGFSLPKH